MSTYWLAKLAFLWGRISSICEEIVGHSDPVREIEEFLPGLRLAAVFRQTPFGLFARLTCLLEPVPPIHISIMLDRPSVRKLSDIRPAGTPPSVP
jgi:hypothetical protein